MYHEILPNNWLVSNFFLIKNIFLSNEWAGLLRNYWYVLNISGAVIFSRLTPGTETLSPQKTGFLLTILNKGFTIKRQFDVRYRTQHLLS
jgi:hypothetical protein